MLYYSLFRRHFGIWEFNDSGVQFLCAHFWKGTLPVRLDAA